MGKLSLLLLLIQPWKISPAVLLSYVMFKIILDYLDSSYICATTHTCRTCMCSALLSVLMVPALHACVCVRVAGPKIDIFWSRPCARFLAKRTSYTIGSVSILAPSPIYDYSVFFEYAVFSNARSKGPVPVGSSVRFLGYLVV